MGEGDTTSRTTVSSTATTSSPNTTHHHVAATSTTTTRVSVVGLPEDAVYISSNSSPKGSPKKGAASGGAASATAAAADSSDDDGHDIVVTIKEAPPASVAVGGAGGVTAGGAAASTPVKKIITTTTTTTTTTIAAAGDVVHDDDHDDNKNGTVIVCKTTSGGSSNRNSRSSSNKKKRYRNIQNRTRPSSSSLSASTGRTGRTASLTASSGEYSSSNSNTSSSQRRSSSGTGRISRKKSSSAASSNAAGSTSGTISAASLYLMEQRRAEVDEQKRILAERIRMAAVGLKEEQELAQQIRLAEAALKRQEQQELRSSSVSSAFSPASAASSAPRRSNSAASAASNTDSKKRAAAIRQEIILDQQNNNNGGTNSRQQPPLEKPEFTRSFGATAAAAVAPPVAQVSYTNSSASSRTGSVFLNEQKRADAASNRSSAAASDSESSLRGASPVPPSPLRTTTTIRSGTSAAATASGVSSTVAAAKAAGAATRQGHGSVSNEGDHQDLTTATCVASPPPDDDSVKPGAYRVPGFNYFGSASTLDTGVFPRPTPISSLRAMLPQQHSSSSSVAPNGNNNNSDNNILCAELVDEDAIQLQAEQQAAVALQRMMDQAPVAQAMPDDEMDDRARRLAQRKKKKRRKCVITWTVLAVVLVNITVAAVVAYGMGVFDNIIVTTTNNKNDSSSPAITTNNPVPSSFWHQIGQDLDGIQESELFGAALGISADGNTLVASAPKYSGGGSDDEGDGSKTGIGQVRAYYYHRDDNDGNNNTNTWKRLGQDLEGRLPNENFGRALSLSPNGKLLAIASLSSVVRVFALSDHMDDDPIEMTDGAVNNSTADKNMSVVWEQLGPDIVSPHSSSWFGQSLSIMDNFVLAVGDVADPTTTSMNVTSNDPAGRVCIFQFIASQGEWVIMGPEINATRSDEGVFAFGQSLQLAMNKDGTMVLAVGAPLVSGGNRTNDDDDTSTGYVSTYRYDHEVELWIPFGSDMQGDGKQANVVFGASVALSADGSMLVVGEAPMHNDTATTGGLESAAGLVVFLLDEMGTGEWTPLEIDIEGEGVRGELGRLLSLSANGKVLATASRDSESGFGQVHILEFLANQDGSGIFIQRGTTLPAKSQGDTLYYKVALSADGDRVAVSNVLALDKAGVETGLLLVFEPNPSHAANQTPLPGCCQAFSTALELQTAVSDFLIANATGKDESKVALVKAKYGEKIGDWDVSVISNFEYLFAAERTPEASTFNEDVSSWNVGNATRMTGMFRGASSFNQDLSSWNVSRVEDMVSMFQDAISFKQNLCPWGLRLDPSLVNVSLAFFNATACPRTKDPDLINNSPPGPFCTVCRQQ